LVRPRQGPRSFPARFIAEHGPGSGAFRGTGPEGSFGEGREELEERWRVAGEDGRGMGGGT